MKVLTALALALLSPLALATTPAMDDGIQTKTYHYGMTLDVAKVISHSRIPDVCEVVPAYMVYEDRQGEIHRVEYRVFGNGCSN